MDLVEFREKLEAVKWFERDEDYETFARLVDGVTGDEGPQWLDCLLDAICVEEDYGPYESLYNAIWSFPDDLAAWRLGKELPALSRRMAHAPFQVWRFYIPVPQSEPGSAAFLAAAKEWGEADLQLGRVVIEGWCRQSADEEEDWGPICLKLGGKLPEAVPVDAIPDSYCWPDSLKERLEKWRGLPPEDTSERVFWPGGKGKQMDNWKAELPRIVEALALRQGEKWRDVKVWLNPFGTFARELYPDFVEALAKAPKDIRDRALANIQGCRPESHAKLCAELEERGIHPGLPLWPE